MAKFQSTVEAMKEITEANDKIATLLAEDLIDIPKENHSIDIWLEQFSHNKSYKSKKDELIRHEMIITDAEIYLNFQSCPN